MVKVGGRTRVVAALAQSYLYVIITDKSPRNQNLTCAHHALDVNRLIAMLTDAEVERAHAMLSNGGLRPEAATGRFLAGRTSRLSDGSQLR